MLITPMFSTSDGCPIAYTIHSARIPNAPRMVLIHSLALDSSIWDSVVERLAGRAEILTYDCRGHGRSGRQAGRFTTELLRATFWNCSITWGGKKSSSRVVRWVDASPK